MEVSKVMGVPPVIILVLDFPEINNPAIGDPPMESPPQRSGTRWCPSSWTLSRCQSVQCHYGFSRSYIYSFHRDYNQLIPIVISIVISIVHVAIVGAPPGRSTTCWLPPWAASCCFPAPSPGDASFFCSAGLASCERWWKARHRWKKTHWIGRLWILKEHGECMCIYIYIYIQI